MDQQSILETFFYMLGQFAFDRAKAFVESRKEFINKMTLQPSSLSHNTQSTFLAMLTSLAQLAEAEKCYHNHPIFSPSPNSFLTSRNFMRREKSLKDTYEEIRVDFKRIEIKAKQEHMQCQLQSQHQMQNSSTCSAESKVQNSTTNELSSPTKRVTPGLSPFSWFYPKNRDTQNVKAATVSRRLFHDSSNLGHEKNSVSSESFTPSTFSTTTIIEQQYNEKTESPKKISVVSTGSRKSFGQSPPVCTPTPCQSSSSTANTQQQKQIQNFSISDELMAHFCEQLQYFTQARLDLIDIYEKLCELATKKNLYFDGVSFQLSMVCRQYQKYFHHPLLAPIKEGMTIECESLMTLIRASIDIQHWRFLTSVFDLQEAQAKLFYWASSTFNKESNKKRFNLKQPTAPRLYDWLCRYREFLTAKFTLYFHSALAENLPPNLIKSTSSKLTVDFHARLSNFQRKINSNFITMLFDLTKFRDYRGQGYKLPSVGHQQLKGKSTLQPMFIIPQDARPKLESLQAELYMTIAAQAQALEDGYFQMYDPIKKLTYFLTKPDALVVLVIITGEGQKPDRELAIKSFMMEISTQLSGNKIILALNSAQMKSPSW